PIVVADVVRGDPGEGSQTVRPAPLAQRDPPPGVDRCGDRLADIAPATDRLPAQAAVKPHRAAGGIETSRAQGGESCADRHLGRLPRHPVEDLWVSHEESELRAEKRLFGRIADGQATTR